MTCYTRVDPWNSHWRCTHDDIIKWKHVSRYCPFVRGIYRSPVSSPHTGQWHGVLMFSLVCAWMQPLPVIHIIHSYILFMMRSSNGNIFRVTGPFFGEFTGHRWIPCTRASYAELWFFFDLRLNKRLSKQPWGWWFETPPSLLWRHCSVCWMNSAACLYIIRHYW